MVNHECGPSIDCFQAASQLTPKYIFRGVADALQIAFEHVVEQRIIRESSIQLRLPDVVVGVNEARRHDLACRVDRLGTRAGGNRESDLLDTIPLN